MDTFSKLFGSLLALVYHCFDRIVIQGYLPLLTREEHIVHFFRDVQGIYPITKDALRARTKEYQQWVEAFARTHRIPIEWPDTNALEPNIFQWIVSSNDSLAKLPQEPAVKAQKKLLNLMVLHPHISTADIVWAIVMSRILRVTSFLRLE